MTPPNPLAIVYTVDQFCAMMQLSRDKFGGLVKRGELAAFKVGRRTYVAKVEAERWFSHTRTINNVGIGDANVGTGNATPDLHHGLDNGADQRPAAVSGKRKRQPIDMLRT